MQAVKISRKSRNYDFMQNPLEFLALRRQESEDKLNQIA